MTTDSSGVDLLCGVKAIAEYLGLPRRAVQHRINQDLLPVFRIGSAIYARKSTLMKWIAKMEAAATVEATTDAR